VHFLAWFKQQPNMNSDSSRSCELFRFRTVYWNIWHWEFLWTHSI